MTSEEKYVDVRAETLNVTIIYQKTESSIRPNITHWRNIKNVRNRKSKEQNTLLRKN